MDGCAAVDAHADLHAAVLQAAGNLGRDQRGIGLDHQLHVHAGLVEAAADLLDQRQLDQRFAAPCLDAQVGDPVAAAVADQLGADQVDLRGRHMGRGGLQLAEAVPALQVAALGQVDEEEGGRDDPGPGRGLPAALIGGQGALHEQKGGFAADPALPQIVQAGAGHAQGGAVLRTDEKGLVRGAEGGHVVNGQLVLHEAPDVKSFHHSITPI